jgi:hypothetical protein
LKNERMRAHEAQGRGSLGRRTGHLLDAWEIVLAVLRDRKVDRDSDSSLVHRFHALYCEAFRFMVPGWLLFLERKVWHT